MIKKYNLHNFKNHADTEMNLSNLTIFTGMNGMGKSSVMQSMLLLRDTFLKNPMMQSLFLDGRSTIVGGSAGLVNCNIRDNQDRLQIGIMTDEADLCFCYLYPISDEDELDCLGADDWPSLDEIRSVSLFTDNFQYLSAFRIGPQAMYSSNTSIVDKHRQLSDEFGKGEYTAYFLNKFGNEDIPISALRHEETSNMSLYAQTEAWLNEISDGVRMRLNQNGKNIEMSFGYQREGNTPVFFKAVNTGFGISYSLSVIVAVLSAKPGALIMIENPEAHIHPSGQASLMRLISKAAQNGVQILLETHSDHVVNGALVNSKLGVLSREKIKIFFFECDDNHNANPREMKIGANGRIKPVPRGFFDQMDSDTEVLFDI